MGAEVADVVDEERSGAEWGGFRAGEFLVGLARFEEGRLHGRAQWSPARNLQPGRFLLGGAGVG